MSVDLSSSATKSLKKHERAFTAKIREEALAAGWPRSAATKLRVEFAKNDVLVAYPDELAQVIEDLEYGDGTMSPKPVFRKFFDKNRIALADSLAEVSIDYLFDKEVLP